MPCEVESTPERVIPGGFCGFEKYDKSIITNYRIVVTVAPFHTPTCSFQGSENCNKELEIYQDLEQVLTSFLYGWNCTSSLFQMLVLM